MKKFRSFPKYRIRAILLNAKIKKAMCRPKVKPELKGLAPKNTKHAHANIKNAQKDIFICEKSLFEYD